jgi:cell division protein FtsX
MTPEQRFERAERILVMLARAGRKARSEWRERVNIVISMHERHAAESRAESHAINEKINILINSQIETAEVVRKTGEQLSKTDEQLRNLGTRHDQEMAELRHSQKLTDQALRAFIHSLRKKPNGNSSI